MNSSESHELPESGEEYLRQVQFEALNCPSVVVADNIDADRFAIKQTVKDNGCSTAPGGFAPNLNWQKKQVADFSKLRMSLSRYSNQLINQDREGQKKYAWPEIGNEVGWCMFCFGEEFQSQLGTKYSFISPGKCGTESSLASRVPPNLSVVSSMSQPLITKVLEYHIDWFEVTGYSVEQGRWLFALLACLEKPLTPEMCSSLRSLARHCAKFRASLDNPEDESLSALNLFICLVARYFDQGDMADTSFER